jgi:uncharacterized protein
VVFFKSPGVVLALFGKEPLAKDAQVATDGSFSGVTLAHNVETAAMVDAFLKKATQAGATIVNPAHDAFWGGRSGYFRDLDGHVWEVAWNSHWPIKDGVMHLP